MRITNRFGLYGALFLLLITISALTSTEVDRPERYVREAQMALPEQIFDNPYQGQVAEPRAVAPELGGDPARSPAGSPETLCSSVEYPSRGRSKLTRDEEARVEQAFAAAKVDLLRWLDRNHKNFRPYSFETLREQVQQLELRVPTSNDDPDLRWRGIGVWTREAGGSPILRVGPGFATLVERDPERARFELIRLAALGWAPCELARVGARPWGAYLQCMGIAETDRGCGVGNYSEAGWAVSSAVATMVAKGTKSPGCTLPAFAEPARAGCPQALLKKETRHDDRQPSSTRASRTGISQR
jgi:hypothetical protein